MVVAAGGVVGADGALPLPWLGASLEQALGFQRGHALLLRAAPGAGALAWALVLAQSRLCEAHEAAAPARLACGRCGSCRLVQAQAHPDLFVLLPESQRRETGWWLSGDKPEGDDAKRKPSRQIRIDEVRSLVDWVTKTSSRGRGKMVVLHPVEALNQHAASALLKTVEEPPPGTRLVLTCADAQHVMPTVRSRCQQLAMPAPDGALALSWLSGQGVARPEALLAACDGQPLEVLAWQELGIDAAAWEAWPAQLAAGRPGLLGQCSVAQGVALLSKVCHDAMAMAAGGRARYFAAPTRLFDDLSPSLLARWSRELMQAASAAEHPWHESLSIDALTAGARRALSTAQSRPASRVDSHPDGRPDFGPGAQRFDTLRP